jgi:hypothetical protein
MFFDTLNCCCLMKKVTEKGKCLNKIENGIEITLNTPQGGRPNGGDNARATDQNEGI